MVLPIAAIEATLDIPELVEIKPGAKSVRIAYRATLRNTGEETRVLHVPSTDHSHFWHLFDENMREKDRERGSGKGGQKENVNPMRFRGLTLGPGQEVHETKTIRIDPKTLRSGANRWLLRVDLWGQSAEAEFHTVVRAARSAAAKKRTAKKKAVAKKKAAAKRKPAKKKAASKRKPVRKKAVAKRKASPTKKTMARKRPAKKRAGKRK